MYNDGYYGNPPAAKHDGYYRSYYDKAASTNYSSHSRSSTSGTSNSLASRMSSSNSASTPESLDTPSYALNSYEVDALFKERNQLADQLHSATSALERLHKTRGIDHKEVERLKEAGGAKDDEVAKLKVQLADMQRRREADVRNSRDLNEEYQKAMLQKRVAEEKNEALQQTVDDLRKELEQAKEQVVRLTFRSPPSKEVPVPSSSSVSSQTSSVNDARAVDNSLRMGPSAVQAIRQRSSSASSQRNSRLSTSVPAMRDHYREPISSTQHHRSTSNGIRPPPTKFELINEHDEGLAGDVKSLENRVHSLSDALRQTESRLKELSAQLVAARRNEVTITEFYSSKLSRLNEAVEDVRRLKRKAEDEHLDEREAKRQAREDLAREMERRENIENDLAEEILEAQKLVAREANEQAQKLKLAMGEIQRLAGQWAYKEKAPEPTQADSAGDTTSTEAPSTASRISCSLTKPTLVLESKTSQPTQQPVEVIL
ncbi:hypothetical protein FRB98_002586 [Tulasnella sp. 332]|nr:hypothetical protein FRB98_002586 [Tulasnella sp. 332]